MYLRFKSKLNVKCLILYLQPVFQEQFFPYKILRVIKKKSLDPQATNCCRMLKWLWQSLCVTSFVKRSIIMCDYHILVSNIETV